MENKQSLETRNYDVNDLVEDKRFLRCKQEMYLIFLIAAAQIIIPAILIYSLSGNGKYFIGYPMWYSVTFIFYFFIALTSIFVALKLIKTHKLDAVADDCEEEA